MRRTLRAWAAGWAGLTLLCGPVFAAEPEPARAPRSVDVVLALPSGNFAFLEAGHVVVGEDPTRRWSSTPLIVSTGASAVASLGISLVASTVIAAVEVAAAAMAREAAGPVGASLADLDLRATVAAQLQSWTPPGGTQWVLSADAFPVPEPLPEPNLNDRDARIGARLQTVDADRHLHERARRSAHEATLFLQVLPLFRGQDGRPHLSVRAQRFGADGRQQDEWTVQVPGPEGADLERPALIRWWADGRYRRYLLHSLRAALLPVAEDIALPAQRAERQARQREVLARRFDETGRLMDPMRDFNLNALHMRTSSCALEPGARVMARVERLRAEREWRAAVYCASERFPNWTVDTVPGISWARALEALTTPAAPAASLQGSPSQ